MRTPEVWARSGFAAARGQGPAVSRAGHHPVTAANPSHPADPANRTCHSPLDQSEREAASPDQLGDAVDPWPWSPREGAESLLLVTRRVEGEPEAKGPQAAQQEIQEVGPSGQRPEIS